MKQYFKGWNSKKEMDFIAVYDDAGKSIEEKDWTEYAQLTILKMVEVNGKYAEYNNVQDAEKDGYFFAREITEEEYNIYLAMRVIYREVWMHDVTGGYPRQETIQHAMSNLRCELMRWMTAIKE